MMIGTDRPPRRDIYQRARLFDDASFTHHGKMNLNLIQAILDDYTDPGDLVVDPMGGSGSVLVGLLTGRHVATGDIELQWARLLKQNQISLARRSIFAFATSGLTAQWDAAHLPLASGWTDLVITSPPYFDTFSNWDASSNILETRHNRHGLSYGVHPQQVANRHVYEDYLRAMREIYAEAKRILCPGGKLVLVVKDVIRGGRVVPVVRDNELLARAVGFSLLERFDVPARGTRFRNVNQVKLGQKAPPIEPVLVFDRSALRRGKLRFALIELPLPHDGPGWMIATKAVSHARGRGFDVWVRSPGETRFRHLVGDVERSTILSDDHQAKVKARIRREISFSTAAHLVKKVGLAAGDEIAFYGSQAYGKYLCRRLETLGCSVTQPLAGLNNGQRLRWLTEKGEGCGKLEGVLPQEHRC